MKITNVICNVGFLVSLSVMSTMAMARGFYGVVDVGQSSFKDNSCLEGFVDMRCSTTATAFRLGGGYQFSQYFGLEVDYGYLGSRKMLGTPYSPPSASGEEKWSIFQFGAIGTIPLSDDFSFFGRLGVAEVRVDYIYDENIGGTNVHLTGRTPTGILLSGGLGAQYDVSKRFAVRAQYEYFNGLGKEHVVHPVFSLSSVGVVLKF